MAKHQRGFTLVELILATALFSFVLLVLTSGIIKLFQIYQAGVGIRNTQQAARLIADDLVRNGRKAVAFRVFVPTNPSLLSVATTSGAVPQAHDAICFYSTFNGAGNQYEGTIFYSQHVTGNEFNVFRARITNQVCNPVNRTGPAQRLNSTNVSILKFDISEGPTALVDLRARVAQFDMVVGAISAIQPGDLEKVAALNEVSCRPQIGSQFCSATSINGGVALRNLD